MILTTPAANPVTTPVELTVAIEGLLLLHVPPRGVAERVIVALRHIVLPPEIVAPEVTVIVFVALQLPKPYVIVTVPADMPVTIPVEDTVAMPVLLLLHEPPSGLADSASVEPAQTVLPPAIVAPLPIEIGRVAMQPPAEYDIVTIPVPKAVTKPVDDTDAIVGALDDHVPPVGPPVNDMVEPEHMLESPPAI